LPFPAVLGLGVGASLPLAVKWNTGENTALVVLWEVELGAKTKTI